MNGVKILVVDDEETVLPTLRAYLEPEGFTGYSAADGQSALKAAWSCHPDLIVLDLMLPGMDGLEVLRRLRQESQVYVLLLTAKTTDADKLVGLGVGADDYLPKPFSPRELVARVKAICAAAATLRSTIRPSSFAGCVWIPPHARCGKMASRWDVETHPGHGHRRPPHRAA